MAKPLAPDCPSSFVEGAKDLATSTLLSAMGLLLTWHSSIGMHEPEVGNLVAPGLKGRRSPTAWRASLFLGDAFDDFCGFSEDLRRKAGGGVHGAWLQRRLCRTHQFACVRAHRSALLRRAPPGSVELRRAPPGLRARLRRRCRRSLRRRLPVLGVGGARASPQRGAGAAWCQHRRRRRRAEGDAERPPRLRVARARARIPLACGWRVASPIMSAREYARVWPWWSERGARHRSRWHALQRLVVA